MKLKENFIRQDATQKVWDWKQYKEELKYKYKYKYKNEHAGDVKTYKLSKEELEEYLSKYNRK